MITNREEVLDKAFRVFLIMNYEKASINTLAKACGLTKTGIVYYFPHKLDLFMAVADKYVLQLHDPATKFAAPTGNLGEFIEQYVEGVSHTMERVVEHVSQSGQSNSWDVKKALNTFRSMIPDMFRARPQRVRSTGATCCACGRNMPAPDAPRFRRGLPFLSSRRRGL